MPSTVHDAGVLADFEECAPRRVNVGGRALVLVRPDGHVAWRGDKVPKDPMSVIDRVRGAEE